MKNELIDRLRYVNGMHLFWSISLCGSLVLYRFDLRHLPGKFLHATRVLLRGNHDDSGNRQSGQQ